MYSEKKSEIENSVFLSKKYFVNETFKTFLEILWLFSYQELATDSSLLTKNLPVYVIRISYSSRIKKIWIIYKLWVFCIHQIYYLFRIEIFIEHVNGHSSVNSVICSWSLRLNTKQITRLKKPTYLYRTYKTAIFYRVIDQGMGRSTHSEIDRASSRCRPVSAIFSFESSGDIVYTQISQIDLFYLMIELYSNDAWFNSLIN